MVEKRLLNEFDVERDYGFKVTCLRAWRYHGRGPAFCRLGRLVRYRREDIDRWLAASTVMPAREASNA